MPHARWLVTRPVLALNAASMRLCYFCAARNGASKDRLFRCHFQWQSTRGAPGPAKHFELLRSVHQRYISKPEFILRCSSLYFQALYAAIYPSHFISQRKAFCLACFNCSFPASSFILEPLLFASISPLILCHQVNDSPLSPVR